MARYIKTIDKHDRKGRIWLFYEGTNSELVDMFVWARDNDMHIDTGNVDAIDDLAGFSSMRYRMGFIFTNKNDAMRFKLTW